jgi:molecular chaperone HscB
MSPDPFDLLGLSPSFDLTRSEIRAAHLARTKALHPDLASADPDAAADTAALNEARRVLEEPESRADALLRRLGGPTREQERALPPGFLAEMMEVRESIESARGPEDVARWEKWAEDRRQELIRKVSGMFAARSTSPAPDQLRAIRVELNVWRYIERLVEQLDPNLGDRGPAP